jgi:hypothetical protein
MMTISSVSFENRTVSIDGVSQTYDPIGVELGDWCPWNQWTPVWSNADVKAFEELNKTLVLVNSDIAKREKLQKKIEQRIANDWRLQKKIAETIGGNRAEYEHNMEEINGRIAVEENELQQIKINVKESREDLTKLESLKASTLVASNGGIVVDRTTWKPYLNEFIGVIWLKCFGLFLGTPVVQTALLICNVAYRLFNLLTFVHFWKEHQKPCSFTARLLDFGADLLRIVAAPLALVGLELAALYGLLNPRDGRKLYATIERAEYGDGLFAPCFQPEAKRHLLGSDINQRNGW